MTAVALLAEIEAAGLGVALGPDGRLGVRGPGPVRARWLPTIREHKAALIELLSEADPLHGFTREELRRACYPDEWQQIEANPEALAQFARCLRLSGDWERSCTLTAAEWAARKPATPDPRPWSTGEPRP